MPPVRKICQAEAVEYKSRQNAQSKHVCKPVLSDMNEWFSLPPQSTYDCLRNSLGLPAVLSMICTCRSDTDIDHGCRKN